MEIKNRDGIKPILQFFGIIFITHVKILLSYFKRLPLVSRFVSLKRRKKKPAKKPRYIPQEAGRYASQGLPMTGVVREYYEDGSLYRETPYQNGEVHGIEKNYDKNGRLIREAPFRYSRGFY